MEKYNKITVGADGVEYLNPEAERPVQKVEQRVVMETYMEDVVINGEKVTRQAMEKDADGNPTDVPATKPLKRKVVRMDTVVQDLISAYGDDNIESEDSGDES